MAGTHASFSLHAALPNAWPPVSVGIVGLELRLHTLAWAQLCLRAASPPSPVLPSTEADLNAPSHVAHDAAPPALLCSSVMSALSHLHAATHAVLLLPMQSSFDWTLLLFSHDAALLESILTYTTGVERPCSVVDRGDAAQHASEAVRAALMDALCHRVAAAIALQRAVYRRSRDELSVAVASSHRCTGVWAAWSTSEPGLVIMTVAGTSPESPVTTSSEPRIVNLLDAFGACDFATVAAVASDGEYALLSPRTPCSRAHSCGCATVFVLGVPRHVPATKVPSFEASAQHRKRPRVAEQSLTLDDASSMDAPVAAAGWSSSTLAARVPPQRPRNGGSTPLHASVVHVLQSAQNRAAARAGAARAMPISGGLISIPSASSTASNGTVESGAVTTGTAEWEGSKSPWVRHGANMQVSGVTSTSPGRAVPTNGPDDDDVSSSLFLPTARGRRTPAMGNRVAADDSTLSVKARKRARSLSAVEHTVEDAAAQPVRPVPTPSADTSAPGITSAPLAAIGGVLPRNGDSSSSLFPGLFDPDDTVPPDPLVASTGRSPTRADAHDDTSAALTIPSQQGAAIARSTGEPPTRSSHANPPTLHGRRATSSGNLLGDVMPSIPRRQPSASPRPLLGPLSVPVPSPSGLVLTSDMESEVLTLHPLPPVPVAAPSRPLPTPPHVSLHVPARPAGPTTAAAPAMLLRMPVTAAVTVGDDDAVLEERALTRGGRVLRLKQHGAAALAEMRRMLDFYGCTPSSAEDSADEQHVRAIIAIRAAMQPFTTVTITTQRHLT